MTRWLSGLAGWLICGVTVALVGCGSSDSGSGVPDASIAGTPSSGGSETPVAPVERKPPLVEVTTSLGTFKIELHQEHTPLTVDNFLSYVESGHYQDTLFHEAVKGNIVLGGGLGTDYQEKTAQYPIRNEAHKGGSNKRGTVSMARQPDIIDSSTCQFFINVADNDYLDHKSREPAEYGYCVFGTVVEGMDVVDKIADGPVHAAHGFESTPQQQVVIRSMKRVR